MKAFAYLVITVVPLFKAQSVSSRGSRCDFRSTSNYHENHLVASYCLIISHTYENYLQGF